MKSLEELKNGIQDSDYAYVECDGDVHDHRYKSLDKGFMAGQRSLFHEIEARDRKILELEAAAVKREFKHAIEKVELGERIADADSVIEMYADEDTWSPSHATCCPAITNGDVSNYSLDKKKFVGGRAAREYKKRWEGK